MVKILTWIEQIMDYIARYTLMILFSIMFVVGLVIKAMYNFNDSPYFEFTTIYDIFAFVVVFGLLLGIYKNREWIQNHINYKACLLLFAIASGIFIWQVPLKPFSDMRAVYEGAINFAKFDWVGMLSDDYWNIFPGNMVLTVFWGILIIPFPKTLVMFKVLNAAMLYLIIALTREIAREYKVKYYNIVYILMLTFSPLFLYINMVYFDIPLIFFCVLGLYVYKKHKKLVLSFAIIAIACFLRKSGKIFLIAMIILYLFDNKEMWKTKEWIKRVGILLVSLAVYSVIYEGSLDIVRDNFITGKFKAYPSWNMYYMGINEEEFGFQDNNFSYDRTAQDVINRVVEYGPVRLTKILTKKTFWLWTQGTYQAQRYAFGPDMINALDKFEYETFTTKYLMQDTQITRKAINAFMRAQYYAMFGLMILTMYKKKNTERFRIFYYIIIATFLAMLIYELKSRYILHLVPLMVIMAGDYFEILDYKQQKSDVVNEV